jgi:TetR/AcrR family transcriptional regulator
MARSRSAGYDQQREAILARAAELFANQGYPGTSMNQVAAACGVTKPALYHYFRDKDALLAAIGQGHIDHLEAIVDEVRSLALPPQPHLRELVGRFVRDYAHSQHEHRVLTEDVKFLPPAERERVLDGERRVVRAFADAIAAVRPELAQARLHKPLTMLLFGMMNWLFTWLRPDGPLTHDAMAEVATDLLFGGLGAVQVDARRDGAKAVTARRRRPAAATEPVAALVGDTAERPPRAGATAKPAAAPKSAARKNATLNNAATKKAALKNAAPQHATTKNATAKKPPRPSRETAAPRRARRGARALPADAQ